jgi:hypothetical protein
VIATLWSEGVSESLYACDHLDVRFAAYSDAMRDRVTLSVSPKELCRTSQSEAWVLKENISL